jgi:flagellar basal-body rod protein FlgC
MAAMDASFSDSISGMHTAITRHDITAHDIANVNTGGYEQRTPLQSDVSPRGVRISHIARTPNDRVDISNTDLAAESGEQIQNKNTLAANASVLKAKDSMIGDVIDLVG